MLISRAGRGVTGKTKYFWKLEIEQKVLGKKSFGFRSELLPSAVGWPRSPREGGGGGGGGGVFEPPNFFPDKLRSYSKEIRAQRPP